MAINIKNLEERIQKKAHVVDSNTSVDDLSDMVEAALLLTGSLKTYADSSELPTATGSNEKIGFIQDIKAIKFNNGKEWVTTASGEVQAPTGPSGPTPTTTYYGTQFGYTLAGDTASSPHLNNIQKISFASDGDATDIADITISVGQGTGGGSSTHGYHMGGAAPGPLASANAVIEKFPYAVEENSVATGNTFSTHLRDANKEMIGDRTNIYTAGGTDNSPTVYKQSISQFSAASDGSTITDYGDLLPATEWNYMAGHSSATHGYMTGGYAATPGYSNRIQKWPFASAASSTDVADLTYADIGIAGTSSANHGYVSGGSGPPARNNIEKFTFASDANATDVGDKNASNYYQVGTSSADNGYVCGGFAPPGGQDYIFKYSHASDGNSTDIGNLAVGNHRAAGTQN
tara:strand:- start:455 stop:1666 length:1212 start_codon:yes stop_codon:yes gene_type:complete